MDAVANYGIPQKVRSDLGGENMEIWRYVIEQHRSDRAVVVGSSTHNERIERLWRDVHRCVASVFYQDFKHLEENEKLDPLNEVDIYCLHRAYLPRINAALDAFVESWNNHPISSEQNFSPNQLFIQGAMQQNYVINTPYHSTDTMILPHGNEEVNVPRSTFQPCRQLELNLRMIDPLTPSASNGQDIYCLIVDVVGHHLSSECSNCI